MVGENRLSRDGDAGTMAHPMVNSSSGENDTIVSRNPRPQNSAYVYIGGIHLSATEGDVITVFSQFGEIVDINLVRDKESGKSKGFCFLAYYDQRSTILAVDNMTGYELLKKVLKVQHVSNYKAPKKFDKDDLDDEGYEKLIEYKATGAEGQGLGVQNVIESQKRFAQGSTLMDEIRVDAGGMKDADELWAAEFEKALTSTKAGKEGASSKAKKKKQEKREKKLKKKKKKEEKKVKKKEKNKAKKEKEKKVKGKSEQKEEKEKKVKGKSEQKEVKETKKMGKSEQKEEEGKKKVKSQRHDQEEEDRRNKSAADNRGSVGEKRRGEGNRRREDDKRRSNDEDGRNRDDNRRRTKDDEKKRKDHGKEQRREGDKREARKRSRSAKGKRSSPSSSRSRRRRR